MLGGKHGRRAAGHGWRGRCEGFSGLELDWTLGHGGGVAKDAKLLAGCDKL